MAVAGALAAAIAGPAPAQDAARFERYFPFRLGDSWTYEWLTREASAAPRRSVRSRVLEVTEFAGKALAYRLVDDDGTAYVYSLAGGAVRIHSSSEGGRLHSYEPPILLAAADQRRLETRLTVDPETGRRFTSTLLGHEDVPTPLGVFEDCLAVRLEMQAGDHSSDSYHYFAPGVGLVAYRYELRSGGREVPDVAVEARLKVARLAGVQVARLEDVARIPAQDAPPAPGKDDASARAVLKRAAEGRYTWDEKFPGFRGEFEYVETGKPPVAGAFEVGRDLDVKVQAPSESARAAVRNQIGAFVNHRRHRGFDEEYAKAVFRRGAAGSDGQVEILAEGDTMGTSYLVGRAGILKVGRSVGRLRYVATNLAQAPTGDRRSIASEYELAYYSNEDGRQVSAERISDSYARLGEYWLPTGRRATRSEAGREVSGFELKLTGLRYRR